MKVRGVVFDFGQVLTHIQNGQSLKKLASITGLDPKDFTERYRMFREPYDRGKVIGREYWSNVIGTKGEAITDNLIEELIKEDMQSWFSLNREMISWIESLKESGIKRAILSNMPPELGQEVYSGMKDLVALFDTIVFSFETGYVKPESEIYEICLKKVSLSPGEVLFIDDDERNIEGARKLGINTFLFVPGKTKTREIAECYGLPGNL